MDIERFSFGLFENESITSGFNKLEDITGGWQRGDLIMIAAPVRMGKTAFAISMLRNNLLMSNKSIIWLSTFLSANQFRRMFFCNHTGANNEDVIIGQVNGILINEVHEIFLNNNFYFYDKPNLTNKLINQILDSLSIDALPDYIIIDNLNYLEFITSEPYYIKEKQTNIKLLELKALAREFNIPIIVLFDCEFPDFKAKDEFCVDSVRLGFDITLVDTLCFIHRPEYYKIIENEKGESTLGKAFFLVAQSRYKTGFVLLEYNPLTFSFKQSS